MAMMCYAILKLLTAFDGIAWMLCVQICSDPVAYRTIFRGQIVKCCQAHAYLLDAQCWHVADHRICQHLIPFKAAKTHTHIDMVNSACLTHVRTWVPSC